ncbi:MAG: hypothetical protein LIR50_17430 [Bacillota bacterium]|nr:hypothetical protein [Bacillota bacterium]
MKYYIFKITYWNERIGDELTATGLVSAKSYSDALNAITQDYGEEDICSIDSIQEIESICRTLTLNNAMYNMFKMAHNEGKIESYHLDEKDYKGKAYYDFPEEE